MLSKQVFILFTPKVKSEINLTPSQLTKIQDAFGDCLQVEGDRISIRLTGGQDLSEMESQAMKVLEAPQRKRLEEIWIQRLGGIALADDAIAKKVGLNANQKQEADRLVEQGGNEIAEMAPDGHSPETLKKMTDIRTKVGKKIEALLTEEQKKIFEELKGKPFAMKPKS